MADDELEVWRDTGLPVVWEARLGRAETLGLSVGAASEILERS